MNSYTLNSTANRAAKAELEVRNTEAKTFFSALKKSAEVCEASQNVLGLCSYFTQNWYLPKVPVQDLIYLRQLTVNVICVYHMRTKGLQFF
jgi:hypothetical protein